MMVNKMADSLFRINQDFDSRGIFLNLSGPLSQNLMVEMGGLMKTKMKLEGSDSNTIKKAFSVLVELNQNIIHYSAEKGKKANGIHVNCQNGCGIISVGRENGHYFLLSGNLVNNSKVEKLKSRLNTLREMSPEDLKAAYKQQRKSDPEEESKGAGLGLIDIARKAGKPFEFRFKEIDNQVSFFSLKIVI